MRKTLVLAALSAALLCGGANAQQINVKIGVLTDMASLYADDTGPGSVAAAKLAAQDFMKDHKNFKVEVVSADHQNKPDVATGIASKWFDVDNVDMITDVPTSSVALALMQVGAQKNKALIYSGPGSSDITSSKCNATTVHWTCDTINAIKQGAEFGIVASGQKFAGLLIFAPDIQALGLKAAQGLMFTETFYWDMNDGTRAWTKRWDKERNAPGKLPSMNMAGVYSGTLAYLEAVAAVGSTKDGKAVVDKMKTMTFKDPLFGTTTVRADGRGIHPAYLFEVKKPEESKYPGDLYKLRATIPANEAFRPLKDGGCSLVSG